MTFTATLLLALAMSTDAFATAIGQGATLKKPRWREALRTGLIFGTIEALTPIAGWVLGYAASQYVQDWDHWIAFTLLCILGARMVWNALKKPGSENAQHSKPVRHSFVFLATAGFATSIDAMTVGVSLSFIDVPILPIALAIGFATFAMVTMGVMLGRLLGIIAGRWAEAAGGLVLITIGSFILFEHLSAAA